MKVFVLYIEDESEPMDVFATLDTALKAAEAINDVWGGVDPEVHWEHSMDATRTKDLWRLNSPSGGRDHWYAVEAFEVVEHSDDWENGEKARCDLMLGRIVR